MNGIDTRISEAIRSRRLSLGLSLKEARQRVHVEESVLDLAEQRPTRVPLRALVRLMEGYGALEVELIEICIARPAVRSND